MFASADNMTLREIFQHAKRRTLPKKWLYLPADGEWTLDTDGVFLDWENEVKGADEIPVVAKRNHLHETLDDGTIEQVVDWADRLAGREDDSARLDVFRYYFRFDAFPDRLGAPDPPPTDEIMRRLDREFYDSLEEERSGAKCRHEGCERGTTKFSVFCRVHQFEQVKKRPCPFQH
jgi:hypothetical protein